MGDNTVFAISADNAVEVFKEVVVNERIGLVATYLDRDVEMFPLSRDVGDVEQIKDILKRLSVDYQIR